MTHEMRLHPEPFAKIRNGFKVIEARLNDEKRQEISVGDDIQFALRPDFIEKIDTEVIELLHAPTFAELYALCPLAEFGITEQETEDMYQYYSKKEEATFGVVGIKFKLVQ